MQSLLGFQAQTDLERFAENPQAYLVSLNQGGPKQSEVLKWSAHPYLVRQACEYFLSVLNCVPSVDVPRFVFMKSNYLFQLVTLSCKVA